MLSAYLTSLPPRFLRFPYSFTHPHTNQGGLAFQCKSLYRSSSSVIDVFVSGSQRARVLTPSTIVRVYLRCLAWYLEYRKHYIHFFIGEVIIISFLLSCFFPPFSYSRSYLIYFSTHVLSNDCVTGSGLDAEEVSNSVPTLKEFASPRANPPGKQTGGVWCARWCREDTVRTWHEGEGPFYLRSRKTYSPLPSHFPSSPVFSVPLSRHPYSKTNTFEKWI